MCNKTNKWRRDFASSPGRYIDNYMEEVALRVQTIASYSVSGDSVIWHYFFFFGLLLKEKSQSFSGAHGSLCLFAEGQHSLACGFTENLQRTHNFILPPSQIGSFQSPAHPVTTCIIPNVFLLLYEVLLLPEDSLCLSSFFSKWTLLFSVRFPNPLLSP